MIGPGLRLLLLDDSAFEAPTGRLSDVRRIRYQEA